MIHGVRWLCNEGGNKTVFKVVALMGLVGSHGAAKAALLAWHVLQRRRRIALGS